MVKGYRAMDTTTPALPLANATHLRLAVCNPAPERQTLVFICREDGAGGIELDIIGQDGRTRPARLAARDAAGLKALIRASAFPSS